jgi:hypothetical protein
MDHELGEGLDRRTWSEIDRAIEGGVEVMVVSQDKITDYYIDTAADDLFLQVHADGTVHTFAWDGIRTGDDLRLRAFRDAGIRPLRIPEDDDTVMYIEAAEIDLDRLMGDTFDGPRSYLGGGGWPIGETCEDEAFDVLDQCTQVGIVANCCNREAGRLEGECLDDRRTAKNGVLATGAVLVVGGAATSWFGGAGLSAVAAGGAIMATGMAMDGTAYCASLRQGNFAQCQMEALMGLAIDPEEEC